MIPGVFFFESNRSSRSLLVFNSMYIFRSKPALRTSHSLENLVMFLAHTAHEDTGFLYRCYDYIGTRDAKLTTTATSVEATQLHSSTQRLSVSQRPLQNDQQEFLSIFARERKREVTSYTAL